MTRHNNLFIDVRLSVRLSGTLSDPQARGFTAGNLYFTWGSIMDGQRTLPILDDLGLFSSSPEVIYDIDRVQLPDLVSEPQVRVFTVGNLYRT